MAIGFLKAIPWKHVGLFVAGTIEVVSKVGDGTAGAHPLPCLLFFADGQMCRFDSLLFQKQML